MCYFQGPVRKPVNPAGDLGWTTNPTTVFDIHTASNGINDSFGSPSTIFGASGIASLWPNNWYAAYLPANPQVYFPYINITHGGTVFSSSVNTYWEQTPQPPSVAATISRNISLHYVRSARESHLVS